MIDPSGALVLDTDVTSFLFNQDPIRAPRYEAHTNGRALYLPFVTVAELLFGAEIRCWGPDRRARLGAFIQRYVTVQSDPNVVTNWASIRAHARQHGRPIERQDAWIAAVAVTLNLPLVTHNASHFTHVPLLQIITEPDR
jgi:predicted nucleic acid-binding protein